MQPRKHPTDFDPFATRFKDKPEEAIQYVLAELKEGPVLSFGSSKTMDKALQYLRGHGQITYVKVCNGGHGWQLVKDMKEIGAHV